MSKPKPECSMSTNTNWAPAALRMWPMAGGGELDQKPCRTWPAASPPSPSAWSAPPETSRSAPRTRLADDRCRQPAPHASSNGGGRPIGHAAGRRAPARWGAGAEGVLEARHRLMHAYATPIRCRLRQGSGHGNRNRRRPPDRPCDHHVLARAGTHRQRLRPGREAAARFPRRRRVASRAAAGRGLRPGQPVVAAAGARARRHDHRRGARRGDLQPADRLRARRRGPLHLADGRDQPALRHHHPAHRGVRARALHGRRCGRGLRSRDGAERLPDRHPARR